MVHRGILHENIRESFKWIQMDAAYRQVLCKHVNKSISSLLRKKCLSISPFVYKEKIHCGSFSLDTLRILSAIKTIVQRAMTLSEHSTSFCFPVVIHLSSFHDFFSNGGSYILTEFTMKNIIVISSRVEIYFRRRSRFSDGKNIFTVKPQETLPFSE